MPLDYDNEELEISDELTDIDYLEERSQSKESKLYKNSRYSEKNEDNPFLD